MNSHPELAQQKGIQGERRLRLSVDKVHQSTGKRTSVRAAWRSVCKASCFFRAGILDTFAWKIVIEHNYVALWVKFNISCWFYSNRRTEDISLQSSVCFPSCIVLLMTPATPDHMSHLKTQDSPCKTNISLVKWQKVRLCCFSLVQSAGHLALLSVWGGFLSLQSSPHRDVGFIQGVGPCDSWWQELKIMLILYGTVNPPLRLRCRCQVYLRCVLAVSPQHQARCMKKKKKKKRMPSRDNVTFTFHLTILSVFFFSLGGFFSTSSNPHTPLRLFCRPLKAESRHTLWFDLLVFTPLPPLS